MPEGINKAKSLEMLCNHSKLTTSVIPIGDGVTISYYQEVGKSEYAIGLLLSQKQII